MPIRYLILTVFAALLALPVSAQPAERRELTASRTDSAPKIDGILDDEMWCSASASFSGKFFQISPVNGEEAKFNTDIFILYDDRSVYVAARMHDEDPSQIPQELGKRDDWGKNADVIGLLIDTYDKGQNAVGFFVTSAGVQLDILFYQQGMDEDGNWDAVWKSEIGYEENAWVVEMEIPYYALRFPSADVQDWGLNFYRVSKRFQEESSWNRIDNRVNGWINQSGRLSGLENIEPPVRLSVMPYLSTIYQRDGASGDSDINLAYGADLKYGINESFTLDMTLIPDFSQVRSDNLVLNLTPFEVQYDENRPFFTEGTEMFSKGNLFYSRRVGQVYGSVMAQNQLASDEEVVSYPNAAPLINATKVSGRTNGGLGVGIFNAMTNTTTANVRNSLGGEREVDVDPFTNFNVAVIDQNLKNNSSIGIINTNVSRAGNGRDANITFADLRLRDKTNTYEIYAGGGLGYIDEFDAGKNEMVDINGHRYTLRLGKVSGNFNFQVERSAISREWNINDLGFMKAPNNVTTSAGAGYNIFDPFSIFNSVSAMAGFEYQQIYDPREYSSFTLNGNLRARFKNFWGFGLFTRINPGDSHDYWEPRVEDRYWRQGHMGVLNMFVSSDDRKAFAFEAYKGFWRRSEDGAKGGWLGISPRYRLSDRLNIVADIRYEAFTNTKGWVNFDENDNIIFGNRDVFEFVNELGIQYTFSPTMNLSVRVRNYWSAVEYRGYHMLNGDGELVNTAYTGLDENDRSLHNANFDAFNIDLFYTWQVAPGSFFSIGYKKANTMYENMLPSGFAKNLGRTLDTPGLTTFSARLIWFLDYSTLFGKR